MGTTVNKDPWDTQLIVDEMNFSRNQLQKVGKDLWLTNHEIEVLTQYQIPYQNCKNLKEVLFYLQEELEVFKEEALEEISLSISERDYYQNTNK